ncbi:MAG: recombination mediator RecR [Candidatus Omnitrophota bacterium]
MAYPKIVENLIEKLMKLPGIGRRSAERILFHLLSAPKEDVRELCDVITKIKEGLMFCRICNNLSEAEVCLICSDTNRDERTICVVENPKDVLAIERTGAYRGHYHVLLGSIAPAEGRGPDDLKIHHLVKRVENQDIKEVVIATDPDTEGETTALYITRELKDTGVKISRIGLGIPVGSALEYADLSTLSVSLSSRRQIE